MVIAGDASVELENTPRWIIMLNMDHYVCKCKLETLLNGSFYVVAIHLRGVRISGWYRYFTS